MFSEKESVGGLHLTSTRIIMDAQKELRTNGCGRDQVDRMAVGDVSQRLMQETHTLKTAIKSSEVVKQAVRMLSEDERTPQKRPSYVGISCSVSGYSHLSRYGALSHSRDSSPARGLRSLSRDSSPPGGAGGSPAPLADGATVPSPSRVSLIKQQLREGGRLTDERGRDGHRPAHRADQIRSVSVDRGYLRRYRTEMASLLNGDSSPPVSASTRAPRLDAKNRSPSATTPEQPAGPRSGDTTRAGTERSATASVSRSFVQARIERLYGPGALCSGFRRNMNLNRSLPSRPTPGAGDSSPAAPSASGRPAPLQLTVDTGSAADRSAAPASPGLPVFRHLRPEFRQQLAVKPGRGGRADRERPLPPPADTSPTLTAVPPITAADPPLISDTAPVSLGGSEVEPAPQLDGEEEKPGHRFIKILDAETTRILALATKAENDLNSQTLTPEIEGKVRAAKGKANLLIAQKFQQFRGLCEKNIKAPADDPFPTTGDDLQGFWDMVLIQVHHIDAMMAELDAIRANNWRLPEVSPPRESSQSASSTPNSKASNGSRRSAPSDPAKAEAARARSAARKKMMEQRRRLIEQKRRDAKANGDSGDVEIFVADDK
ncbi:uncharacterized protein LOC122394379 isoform X2 [Amphibalanus amphitrite]|nr:uncharacterized protein LOC122394379 isoform X2 [Amphibalanus amphitrite]